MSIITMAAASNDMLCATCGSYCYDCTTPPDACPICEDDRQYVPVDGQVWMTAEALAAGHRVVMRDDDGMPALGLEPGFAINQRAVVVRGEHASILWEALPLVTAEAVAAITRDGRMDYIALSHPHFYSAMQRWSEALGNIPILIHEADRAWVPVGARNVQFWSGDRYEIAPGLTLLHVAGHFAGSAALHWRDAEAPDGVLFPGDALQVSMNRKHVSFLYSYPNAIPMRASAVERMRCLLADYDYARVFGFTWRRNILRDGNAAVRWSFDRFLSAAQG